MEFSRAWAVVLRHAYLWSSDVNLILVTLYWPLLDVLIWGFLGSWMQKSQPSGYQYEIVFLLGILLWQTVCRTAWMMGSTMDEEFQAQNLINLFTTPLGLREWLAGSILFALILSTITALYCLALIKLFYGISLLYFASVFVIFAPILLLSGVWLGTVGLLFLAAFGKRAREFVYIMAWVSAPFSGAFYPVEVLPEWAQTICYCLPMTYIFEAMRSLLLHNTNPIPRLCFGLSLALLYTAITIMLFFIIFNHSKKKGLARLSD